MFLKNKWILCLPWTWCFSKLCPSAIWKFPAILFTSIEPNNWHPSLDELFMLIMPSLLHCSTLAGSNTQPLALYASRTSWQVLQHLFFLLFMMISNKRKNWFFIHQGHHFGSLLFNRSFNAITAFTSIRI